MQLWLKPSLRYDDCYFHVSYCNSKVSKLLWQGIKVARWRYCILFITEFYLTYKYHRTSKKTGKIDTNGCGRLGIFKRWAKNPTSQVEPSWKACSLSWIWAKLSSSASLLITILTFMSFSTSGTDVEASSASLQSFTALTVSKAKSAYHFTLGKKKYHSLHGQVTQLLWSSKDRPATWVILSMLGVMEYQFLKGLR